MFWGCHSFNNGDKPIGFNTSRDIHMDERILDYIGFNNGNNSIMFDISSVTHMLHMFYNCHTLNIKLLFTNTSKVITKLEDVSELVGDTDEETIQNIVDNTNKQIEIHSQNLENPIISYGIKSNKDPIRLFKDEENIYHHIKKKDTFEKRRDIK